MKIVSPVYSKEMVEMATRKGPFWLRVIYLCVLLFLTTLFLWQLPEYHDPNKYAEVGKYLFVGLAMSEGIAGMLLTPIITAGCIAGEREANTLELLFLTRLKPRNIVMDKALSRISFMVFLFVVTLPFMFIALFLGGVELWMLLVANGYLLCILMFTGGLSILLSTMRKNYVSALVSVYAYQVLIFILTSIFATFMIFSRNTIYLIINPLFAIGALGTNTPAFSSNYTTVTIALVVYAAVAFSFVHWATRKMAASIAGADVVIESEPDDEKNKVYNLGEIREKLISKQLRLRPTRLHLPDGVPWISRESFREFFRVYKPLLLVIAIGLIIILCIAKEKAFTTGLIYLFSYWFLFPLALLVAMVKASSSFSQEKMKGTLPIILTTRLKGPQIVNHTVLSIVSSIYVLCLIPVGSLMIGNLIVSMFRRHNYWDDMQPAFVGVTCLYVTVFAFYIMLGILFSLFSRTSGKAILLTMATAVLLQLVIPVGGAIFVELFDLRWLLGKDDLWFSFSAMTWLYGCSVKEGAEDLMRDMTAVYVLQLLFHGGGAFFIWLFLRTRFNRIVDRQPDR